MGGTSCGKVSPFQKAYKCTPPTALALSALRSAESGPAAVRPTILKEEGATFLLQRVPLLPLTRTVVSKEKLSEQDHGAVECVNGRVGVPDGLDSDV